MGEPSFGPRRFLYTTARRAEIQRARDISRVLGDGEPKRAHLVKPQRPFGLETNPRTSRSRSGNGLPRERRSRRRRGLLFVEATFSAALGTRRTDQGVGYRSRNGRAVSRACVMATGFRRGRARASVSCFPGKGDAKPREDTGEDGDSRLGHGMPGVGGGLVACVARGRSSRNDALRT